MAFMWRALLLAVMVLAWAQTAGAVTLVTPEGESPPDLPVQAWADASAMPSPPGRVWFVNRPCPPPYDFLLACVWGDTLYGGGIGWPGALYHELGHLFSARVLTDTGRDRYRQITGDYAPWNAPPGQDSPEERFADAYWLCAARARYPSIMAPSIQRRVCTLIRREGGWYMAGYRGAR